MFTRDRLESNPYPWRKYVDVHFISRDSLGQSERLFPYGSPALVSHGIYIEVGATAVCNLNRHNKLAIYI